SDFVRDQLMPEFEKGFRDKGYELLGWPEVGFVHLFSKKPVQSIDDLKASRIWLWQGDVLAEAFFKVANIAPIPLSIIDVYSQISAIRGSIDTIYAPPFGAIAMQWNTKVKYASNIPFTSGIGGLVVSRSFFDKLPPDLKILLKETGRETGQKIADIARNDNEQSIQILKESGITFIWDWSGSEIKEFNELRDKAAAQLVKSGYFPETVFNRTKELINSYRKKVAREITPPDSQSP
ncbi:MAG: TRAP transporter substrate-binding protein DctP, partial [Gammaproteobacteria bacterium]|nr:TRAP transporter substrate-binding protein DctP [Gammaproteobacteria bacterium]